MRTVTKRVPQPLLLFWAGSVAALMVFTYSINARFLHASIEEYVSEYLRNTLEDSLFGDNEGIVNDRSSLLEVGERINRALAPVVQSRWYAAFEACSITVNAIDDVGIASGTPGDNTIVVNVRRNAVDRPVIVAYTCAFSLVPYLLWAAIAIASFALIYRLVPGPLSSHQRRRVEGLIAQGYDADFAASLVDEHAHRHDGLNHRQRTAFAHLHCPKKRNYEQALLIASDESVAKFTDDQLSWFLLAIAQDGNPQRARDIALHPDVVEIDLVQSTLSIHGVPVSLAGTPLFYYAWYALRRTKGDGWVVNPRSNRPDTAASCELAALMRNHGGHGRAISDLEQFGLKARTLDQNRSKIKDAIVAAIGPEHSKRYLYAVAKNQLTQRTSYRIEAPAQSLIVRVQHSGHV